MSRRDSRIAAFTLLFESDFHPELKYSEIYEQAEEVRELSMDSFAKKLYETATENMAEINQIIEGTSSITRMILPAALTSLRRPSTRLSN